MNCVLFRSTEQWFFSNEADRIDSVSVIGIFQLAIYAYQLNDSSDLQYKE